MSMTQKKLVVGLWVLAILAIAAMTATVLRGRDKARASEELPKLFEVPGFALIDQDGQPLAKENLLGKVWVADFVFTRCAGPCPMMTERMAGLQKTVKNAEVKLVSFTVDPEHDTPKVLQAYGKKYGADTARWVMATGNLGTIFDVAAGMKIAAKPAEGETPIIHSTKFVLVDREGWIRGYYDGQDDAAISQLTHDADRLAASKP